MFFVEFGSLNGIGILLFIFTFTFKFILIFDNFFGVISSFFVLIFIFLSLLFSMSFKSIEFLFVSNFSFSLVDIFCLLFCKFDNDIPLFLGINRG